MGFPLLNNEWCCVSECWHSNNNVCVYVSLCMCVCVCKLTKSWYSWVLLCIHAVSGWYNHDQLISVWYDEIGTASSRNILVVINHKLLIAAQATNSRIIYHKLLDRAHYPHTHTGYKETSYPGSYYWAIAILIPRVLLLGYSYPHTQGPITGL